MKRTLFTLSALSLLSACGGEPEWVSIYENCKEQVTTQSAEIDKASQESGDNPQMQAMMASMGGMALNIGLSACEMVRSTCENDPDGAACQAMIEQSKNRQPK